MWELLVGLGLQTQSRPFSKDCVCVSGLEEPSWQDVPIKTTPSTAILKKPKLTTNTEIYKHNTLEPGLKLPEAL